MQFAVLSTDIPTEEESLDDFPSYESACNFASASTENEVREVVIRENDRIFFLVDTVNEDEYEEEDFPWYYCYCEEEWQELLKDISPILSLPTVKSITIEPGDYFHEKWLTKDFSKYSHSAYWVRTGAEVIRCGNYLNVRIGFLGKHSEKDTCSAEFQIYSFLPEE